MLVRRVPAALFGTNCYIVAPAAGEECVVIDPGAGVVDEVSAILDELRLRPSAVVLTHAHLDHCFTVTPVCGAHDVPLLVHGDDRYRVRDPYAQLDAGLRFMLEQQFGPATTWREPHDVRTIADGETIGVGSLTLTTALAPGHTEGSVLLSVEDVDREAWPVEDAARTVFSGDVLFASSIGRTDLTGGDPDAMIETLATRILALPDDTFVLPGHGPATDIGRERRENPYLRDVEHAYAHRRA